MKIVMWLALVTACAGSAATLHETFQNPPASARPEVWWHWMNGNVSRAGIVADLDAMAAVGLGGATIFDAGCSVPPGPLVFGTEDWFDTLAFAVSEAAKRNLRICLANCSGYSSAGGPWIAASNAMKTVVWKSVDVTGPREFSETLPALPDPHGFCRDLATLAFPVPSAELPTPEQAGVQVTRADMATNVVFTFTFPAPYAATRWEATWRAAVGWTEKARALLEAQAPDGSWRRVSEVEDYLRDQIQEVIHPRSYAFPETRARVWRLTFFLKPALRPTVADVRLGRGVRVPNVENKAYFVCTRVPSKAWTAPVEACVRPEDVKDLTARLDASGRLTWSVPAGTWRIVRLGYMCNGRVCHPASEKGVGFESDKLSKAATDLHFDSYLAKVCDRLGPALVGHPERGFNNVLVDSWEAGAQNWTEDLARIFQARKGYDLIPWLVTFTGMPMKEARATDGVLADFRNVVAELFAENFSDELARKCHERGLQLSLEAYGTMPSTPELYGRAEDITMTEFWAKPFPEIEDWHVRQVTERAHRSRANKIIAAEAFTAWPKDARWSQDPFSLKGVGDHMYALGVNRIIYHRYAHQPWTEPTRYPGMTMGHWGTHYERTETWWYDQKEWIRYQTRCQYLLQAGVFVEDKREGKTLWTHRRLDDGTDIFFVTCYNGTACRIGVELPCADRAPELWDAETGEASLPRTWLTTAGITSLTLDFKPSGSVFVVFPRVPTAGVKEPAAERPAERTAVTGPWCVRFTATYPDAPQEVTFPELVSWSERPEKDIRHFAGSGTYEKTLPGVACAADARVILDLGDVKNLATVTVNGRTYPTLWRPPFRVDVTDAVKGASAVKLSVRVTNLWPNRLIGDEELPPDCAWNGGALREIPAFVKEGKPSPTGRHTFATWHHWRKGESLLPSGLLGPVALEVR